MESNGSCCDTQIFNECHLQQNITDETIGFPDPDPLPDDTPYFIVADDTFTLRTW